MVEFALVVPILLMLFIAVADFGRIFATIIALEAATRDAAEATANRYVSAYPGALDQPAPAGDPAYYAPLHAYAAGVVCAEMRTFPATNYDPATNTCPDMPVVIVCVHDAQDTECANRASPGTDPIPAECSVFNPAPNHDQLPGQPGARWIEVRACYHFTALLHLPLFSLGDFWLQRTNEFTIPCYFVLGSAQCG